MRILIVNYEYPPLGGGGGVLAKTLAAELARSHDVAVLTSAPARRAGRSVEDGATVVRVPVLGRGDPSRASLASLLSFGPSARLAARRLVEREPPDLVHTFFAIPSGPAGAWTARRARVPHVLTVIGADVYDPTRIVLRLPPLGSIARRVVREADAVAAISTDIARRATAMSRRGGIEVIGCAIPNAPAQPVRRIGGDPVVFVTIARLVARKGLEALVRAVPQGARLVVVGDGPQREVLERAAVPGRVTFTGALDEPAKSQALADADAFVLVSLHEGFGLVYLEAMRAGLPVIAGTIGGQTDFLEHGVNALLVPPRDVEAVGRTMRTLAGDAALRKQLGEAGRATAARYSPQAMADAYLTLYERALRI